MSANINYSSEKLVAELDERSEIRKLLSLIKISYQISAQHVVELGSGLGFNLELFSNDNTVLGVEGLQSACEEAVRRGVPTIQGDLEGVLPLPTGEADVILCLDVLEHLMQPKVCLEEACRLLKPNGLLIINVPNHFTLTGRLRILLGSGIDSHRFFPDYEDWNYPHVRLFQHRTIHSLIELTGFKAVEDRSSFFPCLPGKWVARCAKMISLDAALSKTKPDLFAGGFFFIARKQGYG